MPNIARMLKDEMARLARKQVRANTQGLRRAATQLRRSNAELKRRVAWLESQVKKLVPQPQKAAATVSDEEVSRARFTSDGIKAMRRRLGLSQRELAGILRVSAQAVWLWENRGGRLHLRSDSRRSLLALKSMSKKQLQDMLAGETSG